jgi:hypothetical protein
MVTGPVAFTVTVPPAPFPNRNPPTPTFNPLLLEIDAPLLTFILPALTVMDPAEPSPPVAVEMSPPSNRVSLGVLTVRVPALPVLNAMAVIPVGLFTTVTPPALNELSLCPEIDSCSDAVTDTLPPGPEPKVPLEIPAPPVKLIVSAWTFTSPAAPRLYVEDAILPLFMMRVEVETKTGLACPKPKVAVAMLLLTFCKTNGPRWKVSGRVPDTVIASEALSCRLPVAPVPNVKLSISPPSLSVNCPRRKDRSPAAPAPNA